MAYHKHAGVKDKHPDTVTHKDKKARAAHDALMRKNVVDFGKGKKKPVVTQTKTKTKVDVKPILKELLEEQKPIRYADPREQMMVPIVNGYASIDLDRVKNVDGLKLSFTRKEFGRNKVVRVQFDRQLKPY